MRVQSEGGRGRFWVLAGPLLSRNCSSIAAQHTGSMDGAVVPGVVHGAAKGMIDSANLGASECVVIAHQNATRREPAPNRAAAPAAARNL